MIDHFGGEVSVPAAEDSTRKVKPLPGWPHPCGSELPDKDAIADLGMRGALRFHGHRMPLAHGQSRLASEFLNFIEPSL
jgi:hypothetical protein